MEGAAGASGGIAGRLASTLGALAVDFGNRDLALLGIARIGISYASWCLAIALGVYGFEVGGAVAVGVVALVRLLPGALASPFAGALGDRFPRRSVLIGSGLAVTLVLAGACVAAAMGLDGRRRGGALGPRGSLRRGGEGQRRLGRRDPGRLLPRRCERLRSRRVGAAAGAGAQPAGALGGKRDPQRDGQHRLPRR